MAEKIFIAQLEDVKTNKIVQQHFFTTMEAAENKCLDLQHFEKYGYRVWFGMEKI